MVSQFIGHLRDLIFRGHYHMMLNYFMLGMGSSSGHLIIVMFMEWKKMVSFSCFSYYIALFPCTGIRHENLDGAMVCKVVSFECWQWAPLASGLSSSSSSSFLSFPSFLFFFFLFISPLSLINFPHLRDCSGGNIHALWYFNFNNNTWRGLC